jgi:hypothetical protein
MKDRAVRLARSAAFWLGIFYLALIPTFAFLYASLGHNSFYDSNSKREKGAYEDAAGLRDSLTSDVRRHLRRLTWQLGGHGHIPLKVKLGASEQPRIHVGWPPVSRSQRRLRVSGR